MSNDECLKRSEIRIPKSEIVEPGSFCRFGHVYPTPFLMTLQDGFAEQNFSMAICERGEGRRRRHVPRFDVSVERTKPLFECVGETFVVAPRIAARTAGCRAEQGRIAQQ